MAEQFPGQDPRGYGLPSPRNSDQQASSTSASTSTSRAPALYTPTNYTQQHAFQAPPVRNAPAESHALPTAASATAPYADYQGVPFRQPNFNHPQAQSPFNPPSIPHPPPNFTYMPGVNMSWDWEGAVDYTGLPDMYEPQGQLIREQQQQAEDIRGQDFNIPFPVARQEQELSSPQIARTATSTPVSQNPTSPAPITQTHGQPPTIQSAGTKRKAGSEPVSAASTVPSCVASEQPPPHKIAKSRTISQPAPSAIAGQASSRSQVTRSQTEPNVEASAGPIDEDTDDREGTVARKASDAASTTTTVKAANQSKGRRIVEGARATTGALPAGKVFPIQIGSELFRLSGASISSDAPSYFSHFFGEQLNGGPSRAGELKTLYIDRDPNVFRDIALHLQGYYVRPRDSEHFVKLLADAQFYSLPRLTQQLFKSEIFIDIGGQDFRIPRETFSSPGDSPNFFSLGFAHFFVTPKDSFPGLDKATLLRPPSIIPPTVANRSGATFGELVRLMQGYPVNIRDEAHRADLLRDARYFHLKGLEQRLIPFQISYNVLRHKSEILIRLEDIRQSGITFTPDPEKGSSSTASDSATSPGTSDKPSTDQTAGFVSYMRPFADDSSHILVLEISEPESVLLHFTPGPSPTAISVRATFVNQALARISSLFSVIASKLGLPTTQPLGLMMRDTGGGIAAQPVSPANSGVSEPRVKVRIGADAYVEVDGAQIKAEHTIISDAHSTLSPRLMRRKSSSTEPIHAGMDPDDLEDALQLTKDAEKIWVLRKSHWRLRVVPNEETGRMEVIMFAVRIEAFASERTRNQLRGFLT